MIIYTNTTLIIAISYVYTLNKKFTTSVRIEMIFFNCQFCSKIYGRWISFILEFSWIDQSLGTLKLSIIDNVNLKYVQIILILLIL